MKNETSSQIDIAAATSDVDEFSKAAKEFSTNIPLCSSCSTFSSLAKAGFTTSACSSYDSSIEDLSAKMTEMSSALTAYLSAVAEADALLEEEMPGEEEPSEPPKDPPPSPPPPPPTMPPEEGLDDTVTPPNGENNTPSFEEISQQIENYYNNIPEEKLEDVFIKLYEEAMKHNITIEELLSSDKYNEVILKLLKGNNLDPKDLIEKYGNIDNKAMRKVLLKIMIGDKSSFGLTEKNKNVFNNIFNNYLEIKQISKEEFLKGGNANTQELLNFAIELSRVNNNSDVEKYIKSLKLLSPEAILYELNNITK